MATPFLGEIRLFAGNFAPAGWMFCNGQLLAIADNSTLFNLIGTTYGGDGQTTFALPNLQSRVPVHVGPGFDLAQTGGAETVTLTTSQIPAHSHVPQCNSNAGSQASPQSGLWAASASNLYSDVAPGAAMASAAAGVDGGSQPHDNMVPFLVVNFIFSLSGIFPSQT